MAEAILVCGLVWSIYVVVVQFLIASGRAERNGWPWVNAASQTANYLAAVWYLIVTALALSIFVLGG